MVIPNFSTASFFFPKESSLTLRLMVCANDNLLVTQSSDAKIISFRSLALGPPPSLPKLDMSGEIQKLNFAKFRVQ